jgi:hypothetical protein
MPRKRPFEKTNPISDSGWWPVASGQLKKRTQFAATRSRTVHAVHLVHFVHISSLRASHHHAPGKKVTRKAALKKRTQFVITGVR